MNGVKNAVASGISPQNALADMGSRMAQDIQATIMSNMEPENKKDWAEYKNRHEKDTYGLSGWGTLVYTGAMMGSVNWQMGDD